MLNISGKSQQNVSVDGFGAPQALVVLGRQRSHEVEVTILESRSQTKENQLRALWRERSNNGDRKVVIASQFGDRVTIFGPSQDRQAVTLKIAMATRLLQNFLDAPDLLSAVREIVTFYDAHTTTDMGGMKNKGLFASHHLRENLPKRRDWKDLCKQGAALAEKRHRGLIDSLGFQIFKEERNALVLRTDSPESRVIALVLEDNENFDAPSNRFPASPVSLGLSLAAEHNVPWLILIRKDQIRLHPCKDGVGVGQKGQAETYLELNLSLLDDDNIGLLPLIFSANSLTKDGEVEKLLGDSAKFAASLGNRLRERVYEHVVPPISIAVAKKLEQQGTQLDSEALQSAYSMTLKILFRLLFQAYAEDRGLLPAGRNEAFDANSLKELGKRHMNTPRADFGPITSIWKDLVQVWDAIDVGNEAWGVPAYNGGLFGSDPTHHPEGLAIKTLDLPDSVLGPALQGLLIDETEDGVLGPVDFRALSVREFGTIYEGLLESSLSLAEVDLTVDESNAWVPAKTGDEVLAKAGEPYFHSASGERKATGSYFTPKFLVDHLVVRAIDPAIDAHLGKVAALLSKGDLATAGREFFDFRVADLAMGSAHFLVAAVDRIEAKMRAFLAQPENSVPAVIDELKRLRDAAVEALRGDEIAISEIEDFSLLRRQIARRCIYGIDINYMAVELARLAIWIHTFVPGLPMSTLDHNLVHGNSLTGINSIDEALDALVPGRNSQPTLFDGEIISGLDSARELLIDASVIGEADKREIASARKLAAEAATATKEIALVFDAALAARAGVINPVDYFDFNSFVAAGNRPEVRALVSVLRPAHLPYLFPEVFLRNNGGFDVLIGNPPWEKVKTEEFRFWNLRFPGVIGMPQAQRNERIRFLRDENPELYSEYQKELDASNLFRATLSKGLAKSLGAGDLDLYQVFAIANWQALRDGTGSMGLVLPRSAFVGGALKEWRLKLLNEGSILSLIFATNKGGWLFESVHPQYTVSLLVASKDIKGLARFLGPIDNKDSFLAIQPDDLGQFTAQEIERMSENLSFPSVSSLSDLQAMRTMLKSPKFQDVDENWDFRPTRELDAALDKSILDVGVEASPGRTAVWSGATFNIWKIDHGPIFASRDTSELRAFLSRKLSGQISNRRSTYAGMVFPPETLPMDSARIALRTITNSTNSRTAIASLLPPGVAMTNGPVLVRKHGTAKDEAALLGLLASIPFDWFSRRFVEMNFTFELLSQFPVAREKGMYWERLVELSGRLASVDERYADWAAEVGVPVASVTSDEIKNDLICEIDALVSLMYGLSDSQVEHIFSTFHTGWDFSPRLEKVMDFYDDWKVKKNA